MKLLLPVVAISVPFVTAQTACASLASAIPSCGIQCIYSAGSSVGCATTDYSCLCASAIQAGAVLSSAENCVVGACGATALQVLTGAQAVCSCATANATATSVPASTTTSSSSRVTQVPPLSGVSTVSSTPSETTLIPPISRVSDTTSSSTGLTQIPPFSGVSSVSSSAVLSTPMATSQSSSASSSATIVSANGQGVVRPMGGFWAVLGGLLAFL